MTWSKKLTVYSMIQFTLSLIVAIYVKVAYNINVMEILISTGGLLATCFGFYFNKSKSENLVKLQNAQLMQPQQFEHDEVISEKGDEVSYGL